MLVDLYNSSALSRQAIYTSPFLVAGNHKPVLEYTGTKRAAATATYINLDALQVIGGLR